MTATGAHKMASIDHLHQESLTLRVKDHSDMLSALYLVNCLEEDHASHGITIQEPIPMKETLHSRHQSTVLPRLGSSSMESHQNLNTHAVDSAIQLQGNNRVLKKHPPPILDKEQRLNRRQQCTSRLTCHQRIYGGIRWDQSTTETLTDLKTDLVVANNNNM